MLTFMTDGPSVYILVQNCVVLSAVRLSVELSDVSVKLTFCSSFSSYYYCCVTCHRPFLPGMFLEPVVNPIAHVSSFTL